MTEPQTDGGKFLANVLCASDLRSVSSVEAALANVLHAQNNAELSNDEITADGRPLND